MLKMRLSQWREAMMGENSLSLRVLAENYLGQSDRGKRDAERIVGALAAMMDSAEVQEAALSMMDREDKLILGAIHFSGEADKAALQRILAGEVSFHELEYRLANLDERLLIFRTKAGSYAVNPHFDRAVREGAARADVLFGAEEAGEIPVAEKAFERDGAQSAAHSVQDLGLVAYALLKEYHDILLKGGRLSVKARKRVALLFPGDASAPDIFEGIIRSLLSARIATLGEQGLSVDFKAFSELLLAHEEEFAFVLIGSMSGFSGSPWPRQAALAFAPFLERRFIFSKEGLARFLRLVPGVAPGDETTETCIEALKALGLVKESEAGLVCSPERVASFWRASPEGGSGAVSIDGAGLIHALPSATLRDLLILLDIGILESASGAWTLRITRASARRAFASGRSMEDILQLLGQMSGMPIPQALRFDIERWEDEYNAIRLFRGYMLSADPASSRIIEQSGLLARFPHERLGEGLYFFGNIQAAAIEKALTDVGLPPPALRSSARGSAAKSHRAPPVEAGRLSLPPEAARGPGPDKPRSAAAQKPGPDAPASQPPDSAVSAVAVSAVAALEFADSGAFLSAGKGDSSPEEILATEIERLQLPAASRKKLEKRLKRKLIYTLGQLHAMVKAESAGAVGFSPSSEAGFSARGLDFNGKIRIIQSALKARYSRLDIRWARSGEVVSVALRPVSLQKTDRDYVLEGEDVSSGAALSIRVGSIMQVNLRKGFLLGEE